MKVYLVGGAVRDDLLGLPVVERDWVVVGATADEMLAAGFTPADPDFPVFRHPQTGEEYALARRERKRGEGYRGFVVDAAPDVSLEEDLQRRDLTVNAMARAADGGLVDPYGGRQDLDDGLLRHVSPAFVEDPLRVLRAARFAAKLGRHGFRVAHATHRLMCGMAERGDMGHLAAQRVWRETLKAAGCEQPWRYFEVLHRCGALARLMPALAEAMGTLPAHADRVADSAPVAVLKRVAALSEDPAVRLAALLLPVLPGAAGAADEMLVQWRVDRATAQWLRRVSPFRAACRAGGAVQSDTLLAMLSAWRAFDAGGGDVDAAVAVCQAQHDGSWLVPQVAVARPAAAAVTAASLAGLGLRGAALGERLRAARRAAVDAALADADLIS